MTTQDFIALFQEAFGKKVQLPLLFGYSDKPIANANSIQVSQTCLRECLVSCR